MELYLDNARKYFKPTGINQVVYDIQDYILNVINAKRLKPIDEFLKNSDLGWEKQGKKQIYVHARSCIIYGLYNLYYTTSKNNYIIQIDPNAKIPNTNISVLSLNKLINYGNSELSAYPIYDEAFDFCIKHIMKYIKE